MNWDNIGLIIFDADGTLRRRKDGSDKAPLATDEWELMPGIVEAIDELRWRAVLFGIASNQACVGREEISHKEALHMLYQLALKLRLSTHENAIKMCPHLPGTCSCRKPEPAMLNDIIRFWRMTPEVTVFIGDDDIDQQTAENCGCHFMYVNQFLELGKE